VAEDARRDAPVAPREHPLATPCRVALPKDRFLAMPKEDRAFFLQIGNISNQISLVARLLLFMGNRSPNTHENEDKLLGPQAHILSRIFAGILHEAWTFTRFHINQGAGKAYSGDLSPLAAAALAAINKQFAQKTILGNIRTNAGFHNKLTAKELDPALTAVANDPEFDDLWFLHDAGVSWGQFNAVSEMIFVHATLQMDGNPDLSAVAEKFMAEANKASANFMELLTDYARILTYKYFDPPRFEREEVGSLPHAADVYIPFFVEP
jgi:hypothetical protein